MEGARWKRRKKKDWPSPLTEAVELTIPPRGKATYAEVLGAAQREVSLEEIDIP